MTFTRRQLLQTTGASGAAALLASIGQMAFAQQQHATLETANIITGFAAGGTSDNICRRLALKLSPDFARTVVVENRTGAGGQIAIGYVKGRPADGTAILQTPTSMLTIYPHIYKKLPYDFATDLTPVSLGCSFDFGVCRIAVPSARRCRPT
jgi:tripartite-type tricarboxylate transporter receptor subunit TctC